MSELDIKTARLGQEVLDIQEMMLRDYSETPEFAEKIDSVIDRLMPIETMEMILGWQNNSEVPLPREYLYLMEDLYQWSWITNPEYREQSWRDIRDPYELRFIVHIGFRNVLKGLSDESHYLHFSSKRALSRMSTMYQYYGEKLPMADPQW